MNVFWNHVLKFATFQNNKSQPSQRDGVVEMENSSQGYDNEACCTQMNISGNPTNCNEPTYFNIPPPILITLDDSPNEDGKSCRICHQLEDQPDADDNKDEKIEELVSPCKCSGTNGWVHVSCLEQWLTVSKLGKCEVCKCAYKTILQPPPLTEYIKDCSNLRSCFVHSIPVTCLLMTIFLIFFSSYHGPKMKYTFVDENASTFIIWLCLSIVLTIITASAGIFSVWKLKRYHQKQWKIWRNTNPRTLVKLILDPPVNQINPKVESLDHKIHSNDHINHETETN